MATRVPILMLCWLTAAAARAEEPVDRCAGLLTLSAGAPTALTPEAVRAVTGRLTYERVTGVTQFVVEIRDLTTELVHQKRVTADEAEVLFAQNVLGNFSPIFRRFIVAELKARGFDDQPLIDFIRHFDKAFTPDAQVDFAVAVARRMLVTINDDTSTHTPKGIEQFLNLARAFVVDEDAYAQFLQIWSIVRLAHAQTVVRFILANVRNVGREIRAFIEGPSDVEPPPAAAPAGSNGAWKGFWRSVTDAAPYAPPRASPAPADLAREFLGNLEVPAELSGLAAFDPDAEPMPLLGRLLGQTPPPGNVLERLELTPPYAWDYLVAGELGRLDPAALRALMKSRVFTRLDERVRARASDLLATFEHLERLVTDVRRRMREEDVAFTAWTGDAKGPNEKAVLAFYHGFLNEYQKTHTINRTEATYTTAIIEALRLARQNQPSFTGPDFREAAGRIMQHMCVKQDLAAALATGRSLAVASRAFPITDDDLTSLFAMVDLYEFGSNPMRRYTGSEAFFDRKGWGKTTGADAPGRAIRAPSAELIGLVEAFRAALPADEGRPLTNDDILRLIDAAGGAPAPGR